MAIIGQGISLRGMTHDEFHYPFYLASGITKADEGKAVTLDTTGPNKVKLAGDDDPIIGVLVVVENRAIEGILVGTVALRGGFRMKKAASAPAISVGDTVVGAGGGEVKAAASADPRINFVAEVEASGDVIVVL